MYIFPTIITLYKNSIDWYFPDYWRFLPILSVEGDFNYISNFTWNQCFIQVAWAILWLYRIFSMKLKYILSLFSLRDILERLKNYLKKFQSFYKLKGYSMCILFQDFTFCIFTSLHFTFVLMPPKAIFHSCICWSSKCMLHSNDHPLNFSKQRNRILKLKVISQMTTCIAIKVSSIFYSSL